jgi:hypothetical protein
MKITPVILVALGLVARVTPAAAQWERVTDVPLTNCFSVWASGDTIVAGADSLVYVSVDGGDTFKASTKPGAGVRAVTFARMRGTRLFAGTYGQGVFVSDNLGSTWSSFNQGLTGLAVFIDDMAFSSTTVYAATAGDGVWSRNLSPPGNWGRFGDVFEPNQASNVAAITLGGTKLIAAGGANGMIFVRDPGDTEWNISFLDNVNIHPSWTAQSAFWTGSKWFIGANLGVFQSATGAQPWLFGGPGLGGLSNTSFAQRAPNLLVAFTTAIATTIEFSQNGGLTFQVLETLPAAFFFKMAVHGDTLYAARTDGLWRRSLATVPTQPVTWGSLKSLFRSPGK